MSPVQVLVLLLAMAVVSFVVARLTVSDPDPKRFGLLEAEVAAQYVSTADAARPVMAVVVGVLGYENTVTNDLSNAAAETATLTSEASNEVAENGREIADLERKIARLRAQINNHETLLAEKKRVAALFVA